MSTIVAEEHYIQEARYQGGRRVPTDVQPEHRELRSDLLLVRPAGSRDWLQLRDVFEVDGHPDDVPLERALEELEFFSREFHILGVFPAHPFRDTFKETRD